MKLHAAYQDTYQKTLFYKTYMVYISHKYLTEHPSAYVYISPSQFGTAKENMKRISECLTWTETQR
jgi:hypothetical protein